MVRKEELHRGDGDVPPGRESKEKKMDEDTKMVSIEKGVEPLAVVIFGTIKEGFRVRGPFKDVDAASRYAESDIEPEYPGDWEVAVLESIGEYLERTPT